MSLSGRLAAKSTYPLVTFAGTYPGTFKITGINQPDTPALQAVAEQTVLVTIHVNVSLALRTGF